MRFPHSPSCVRPIMCGEAATREFLDPSASKVIVNTTIPALPHCGTGIDRSNGHRIGGLALIRSNMLVVPRWILRLPYVELSRRTRLTKIPDPEEFSGR